MQGTIKRYFDDHGYGFIVPDRGGGELFFHVKSVTPPMHARHRAGAGLAR
jgi:cold shock CspA family protein